MEALLGIQTKKIQKVSDLPGLAPHFSIRLASADMVRRPVSDSPPLQLEPPESERVIRTTPILPTRPSGFLKSALATAPRYAPGESPFRVKGHVYRSSVGYYTSQLPGGLRDLDPHLEPALSRFVHQHFLTASWYDALPLLPLAIAAAKASGLSLYDAMLARAAAQAEADIHGLYKVILNFTSPETIASRVGRAAMQYFDFGEAVSTALDDHLHEITHSSVPMPLVPLSTPLAEGFLMTALRISGARDATFRAAPPLRAGEIDGTPTYDLRFIIGWS